MADGARDEQAADGAEATEVAARRRRWWFWLPSVALIALLAWVVVDRWSDLPEGGRLPGAGAVAVAIVLHVAGNVLLAQAWREQLRLAGRPLEFGPAAAVWSTSQLSRFLVPGATFGARAVLARRLDVPAATAAATTVFELGWTLLAHPVVVLLALPWWADLPDQLRWLGVAAIVPVAVLVGLVARPGASVRALAAALRHVPVVGRRVPSTERLVAADLRTADAAGLAGVHLANVATRHLAFLVLVSATVDLDSSGVAAVLGASALGRFVGLVAVFAPAGIGPREGMTVLALTPVTGAAPAIVAVAATRLAEVVAEAVVWGGTRRWSREDVTARSG